MQIKFPTLTRKILSEIYRSLLEREFCYVVIGQNISISCLVPQLVKRLFEAGHTVAALDLGALGQASTLERWYGAMLKRMAEQLGLEKEANAFWIDKCHLSPLQRFFGAIRDVFLVKCSGPLVLIVENLDAVRGLRFSTDEFFAAIRAYYNARTEDPILGRLSFCLLGMTPPTSLLRDPRTTAFNIGRRVDLTCA
ncbi:MAG: AAA-like domain-containing protein [Verrucomicrobia bacterium]|nr:AAA-like domain-containing protein [Verrucomicrobiota bacterium]